MNALGLNSPSARMVPRRACSPVASPSINGSNMTELPETNLHSGIEPRSNANGWQSTWLALAALGMLLIGVASLLKSAESLPQAQART
ncbi:MAG TPA: hypothetical protein VG433_15320, partial [Pirellulales bacterium]|nr:hypothetical protein [Pirellulales bacterium]